MDLQYNSLSVLPACILHLPCLVELNLSSNQLSTLPAVSEWPSMRHLDISRNQLTSLPSDVSAPCILSLNVAHNNLCTVPRCVCSFSTLTSLNLSDNPKIRSLPVEMGRLNKLTSLQLQNLEELENPPRNMQRNVRDCISYLNSKRLNAKEFFGMKIVVLGEPKTGKSTLVRALRDTDFRQNPGAVVEVTNWQHKIGVMKKPFHFKIWDLGGEEWHYDIHQCFFTKNALYVVVFDLTKGEAGLEGMKPWLEIIASRGLSSQIIIVGTHLDEIHDKRRREIDALMSRAGKLATRKGYSKDYHIREVSAIPVGLKNKVEHMSILKEEIYMQALSYKNQHGQNVMGQKVPSSYHTLEKHMEVIRQETLMGKRDAVMTVGELETMIRDMKLTDICYDEDIRNASVFLNDVGLLTHYRDCCNKLYFLDPHRLSNVLSKILKNSLLTKNGIICSTDIPLLLKEDGLLSKHLDQYLVILARYELAMPLNNNHILVPSKLPEKRPDHLQQFGDEEELDYRSRTILFTPASIVPPGFWSHLLQWMMKYIQKISSNLYGFHSSDLTNKQSSGENGKVYKGHDQICVLSNEKTTPITQTSPVLPHCRLDHTATHQVCSSTTTNCLELETKQSLEHEQNNNLELGISSYTSASNMQLDVWQQGLHYSDLEVMFRIEATKKLCPGHLERVDGVLLVTSPNREGHRIFQTLIRCVAYIIKTWYPALDNGFLVTLGQKVACFECVQLDRPHPFEFIAEDVLSQLARNETSMACGANHTVNLGDIISSLLQQDTN